MTEHVTDLPATIAQLPFFASGRYPKPDLLGRCEGDRIVPTSGRELLERVRDISLGLQQLGMATGQRVVLLAESRPDWLLVDFAILTAGAVTVPIYPTLTAEQCAFMLRDAGAKVLFVSSAEQLAKVLRVRDRMPQLSTIVVFDAAPAGDGTLPYAELVRRGAEVRRGSLELRPARHVSLRVRRGEANRSRQASPDPTPPAAGSRT